MSEGEGVIGTAFEPGHCAEHMRPGFWMIVIDDELTLQPFLYCPGCGRPLGLKDYEIKSTGEVGVVSCGCGFKSLSRLLGWPVPS